MHLEELKGYYIQRIDSNQVLFDRTKRIVYTLGTIRLVLVIVAFLLIFFFWGNFTIFLSLSLASCFIAFLALVLKTHRLTEKKEYLKTSITSDKNELRALDYDFGAYDGAEERIDGAHPFGLDLDLFGKRSFFQSLNRTCTPAGKDILAQWVESPLQDKAKILNRQESVKELSDQPDLMQHFEVTGFLNPGHSSDQSGLEWFAEQPALFTQEKLWTVLKYVFPLLWIAVIVLSLAGYISLSLFTWIYIITFVFSESQLKKVNQVQSQIGKKMKILNTSSELIKIIENWDIHTPDLLKIKNTFYNDKYRISDEIKKLARLSGELDQRSNMFAHLVFNPMFLWDIRKAVAVEKWRRKHGNSLGSWIKALGQFDAYCSLGKYAFNHPDFVYPEISDSYFEMEGKSLGHPLMNRYTCVRNDIKVASKPFFMIVTGANMAGKSTYLRTLGINFLLSCIGSPVCAQSLKMYPAKLYTSLRTSDSLSDNESYFFAELKRLKMIIDELDSGRELFIILDEILKGTNSVDKQKGSLALLKQFVSLQSCGIIATHDLSLGNLEQEFPENVKNYRFEADITNNELTFSYKLREGIAQNMNACFLMQKMGITV